MSGKRKWDDDESSATKVPKIEGEVVEVKAFDAAAEIAARIAAQYAKPVVVVEDKKYQSGARETNDPEFVEDIEINDLRNRYVLTKGPTQQQIHADTGASVTTKGVWYPEKAMATDREPPLYLHVTAETQESLDAAKKAIQELIDKELGPLLDQSRFRDRDAPRERRKWPEEKLPITFEPLRNFNLRAKVVGPGGLFVKYIQQETQTRVQIKGLGSGFIETETGREAEEPIHVHVTGPDQVMVDKAAGMAKDLLEVVQGEWQKAKDVLDQSMQQLNPGMGGQNYGQQQNMYGQQQQQQPMYNNYNQQQQQYPQGYAPLPPGAAPPLPPSDGSVPPPPPPPSSAPPPPPSLPLPAQPAGGTATPEEWSAYWNSLDFASQTYYTQYYAQTLAPVATAYPVAATSYTPAAGAYGGAKGGSGTYGAVPPPAGM